MDEPLTRVLLEEHLSHAEWLLLDAKHGRRQTELESLELERVLAGLRQLLVLIGGRKNNDLGD